jgi:hypothetical protein
MKRTSLRRTASAILKRSRLDRGEARLKRTEMGARKRKLKMLGRRRRREKPAEDEMRAAVLAASGAFGNVGRCARCGTFAQLDVHHRRARSKATKEMKHDSTNGVAVCRPCHDLIETHCAPDWRDWIVQEKPGAKR